MAGPAEAGEGGEDCEEEAPEEDPAVELDKDQ